jgi:hypothetical protein
MSQDTTAVRNDAFTRASALANRARELRRAQSEVQELTTREVQVLARTASSFFDSLPLVEFTTTLLPQSARGLRRIRHRVLHRTIHHTETGTLIRALLLGRDGGLRLFSARSADSRDLLLILEPGRTLPVGVMRDVVDWIPTLRVPGFRPFEILDKLSHSLDAVEEQIGEAEQRVQVQKAALASGDLSLLLPTPPETSALPSPDTPRALSAGPTAATQASAVSPAPASQAVTVPDDPFTIFDRVEAVAEAVQAAAPVRMAAPVASAPPVPSVLPVVAPEDEPDEWDEPVEAPSATSLKRAPAPGTAAARSLFPVMPSPR